MHAPKDPEQYERETDENGYTVVAECNDVESAHIIKGLLESKGIEASTFGESAPKYICTVPVRVLVRKKDKEKAESIINE